MIVLCLKSLLIVLYCKWGVHSLLSRKSTSIVSTYLRLRLSVPQSNEAKKPYYSTDLAELKRNIYTDDLKQAVSWLSTLDKSVIAGENINIVKEITNICRKSNRLKYLEKLLSAIPFDWINLCTEDDIKNVLIECTESKNAATALGYFNLLRGKGFKFTTKTYNMLIKNCGLMKKDRLIVEVLGKIVEDNVIPDLYLFNTAIDSFSRSYSFDRAFALFALMLDSEREEIGNDKAIDRLQSLVTVSKKAFISNQAQSEYLEYFAKFKIKPDVVTFNIILKALRESREHPVQTSVDIVDIMNELKLTPNSNTVNTLVDTCIRKGAFAKAMELVVKNPYQIEVGVDAFNTLLSNLAQQQQVYEATNLLNIMAERKIQPTVFTLVTLVTMFVRDRQNNKAKEVLMRGLRNIETKNTELRLQVIREEKSILYSAYISALSKQITTILKREEIPFVIKDEKNSKKPSHDRSLAPQENRLDIMIRNRLTVYRLLLEIQKILLEMDAQSLAPNTFGMNGFLQVLCTFDSGFIPDAIILFRAMSRRPILPNSATFSILFTAMSKLTSSSSSLSTTTTTTTNTTTIHLQLLQMLRYAIQERIQLEMDALNALLRSLTTVGHPITAVELFLSFCTREVSIPSVTFIPDEYTFSTCIHALTRYVKYLTTIDDIREMNLARGATTTTAAAAGGGGSVDYTGDSFSSTWNDQMVAISAVEDEIRSRHTIDEMIALMSAWSDEIEGLANDVSRLLESAQKYTTTTANNSDNNNATSTSNSRSLLKAYQFLELPTKLRAIAEMKLETRSLILPFPSLFTDDHQERNYQFDDLITYRIENPISEFDTILKLVYNKFRTEFKVNPNMFVITSMNSLFSLLETEETSTTKTFFGFEQEKKPTKRARVKIETARMIFHDLLYAGVKATQMKHIMDRCEFPEKTISQYLDDDYVTKLRKSSASDKIFKKYGWNQIESGWKNKLL